MELRNIIICESAARHPDGTFSLLRGGIDNWVSNNFPVNIQFTFVITVELSLSETNQTHNTILDIIDEDGKRLVPQAKIPFSVNRLPNQISFRNHIMGTINLTVLKPGRHSLDVAVNGNSMGSHEFIVAKSTG